MYTPERIAQALSQVQEASHCVRDDFRRYQLQIHLLSAIIEYTSLSPITI